MQDFMHTVRQARARKERQKEQETQATDPCTPYVRQLVNEIEYLTQLSEDIHPDVDREVFTRLDMLLRQIEDVFCGWYFESQHDEEYRAEMNAAYAATESAVNEANRIARMVGAYGMSESQDPNDIPF